MPNRNDTRIYEHMDHKSFLKTGCFSQINIPSFDVSGIFPEINSEANKAAAARVAKDAAYIAIGFGVLAFQKLQVRRREYFSANK